VAWERPAQQIGLGPGPDGFTLGKARMMNRVIEMTWEVLLQQAGCVAFEAVDEAAENAVKSKGSCGAARICFRWFACGVMGAMLLVAGAGAAQAQNAPAQNAPGHNASGKGSAATANTAPSPGSQAKIAVELNKLETQQSSCRAYLVIDNQSETSFDVLKLDLVLFQTDGIIGRRFALDLAPIRAKKRSVKLFDLDGVKCETVGSFLINDIMECKSGGSDESACLDRLALSTRSNVQLSK